MPRFFVNNEQIDNGEIKIIGEDCKHMAIVLRSKVGDKISVCNGECTDFSCAIKEINKQEITLSILSQEESASEPKTKITLFQALPKADKMELIIQKCVELGVDEIVLVETEFTIVKLNGKEDKKIARFQKISEGAAKQSGRGKVPKIHSVVSFKQALEMASAFELSILAYEKEKEATLKSVIKNSEAKRVACFVGAEGGFSENEIFLCKEKNVQTITLGNRILRTETAGFTLIANILYEWEA